MRKWIGYQIDIKRQRFHRDGGLAIPGAYLVKVKGAAPVVEVLPPEGAQCQCVRVVDNCFRGIDHFVSVMHPAVAELAVLGSSSAKGRVEATYGVEALRRQGQAVGGQKACIVGVSIIIAVQVINKELAGNGIRVIRKRINRPTA